MVSGIMWGRMTKLPLAYYGDPILRKKGARVETINDGIRQLANDMIDTMKESNGLGLAAPQVHHSLAMFVICVPTQQPDESWLPGKVRVFINPKIVSYSDDLWGYVEGCLSIPTIYEDVLRPFKVTVTATDLEGNEFTEEFEGLEAHAVMHENDHINGVLFIDRLSAKKRKELEPRLRQIKKKFGPK